MPKTESQATHFWLMQILQYNIPTNKKLSYTLSSIYGIGKTEANLILEKLQIGKTETLVTLTADRLQTLKDFLERKPNKYGTQKRKEILNNITRQIHLKTYKGFRHKYKYPVRGQRTRSNHQTSRKRTI